MLSSSFLDFLPLCLFFDHPIRCFCFLSSFPVLFLTFFDLWQVSVPCTTLFKTITVRCGHCANLLPVNMRGSILPSANPFHMGHNFFSPHNLLVWIYAMKINPANLIDESTYSTRKWPWFCRIFMSYSWDMHKWYVGIILLQGEIPNPSSNFLINQINVNDLSVPNRGVIHDELPSPPVINRRKIHLIFLHFFSLLSPNFIRFSLTFTLSYILLDNHQRPPLLTEARFIFSAFFFLLLIISHVLL